MRRFCGLKIMMFSTACWTFKGLNFLHQFRYNLFKSLTCSVEVNELFASNIIKNISIK